MFSDVYTDAITGEPVFTISKALEHSGDVLAMDVYINSQGLHNTTQTLPENSSYYLCDTHGTLLYEDLLRIIRLGWSLAHIRSLN